MSRSSNRDGDSSSDSALSLIDSKLFQRRRITSPASVRNSRYAICVPRPDDAANRQTIHTDIVERQPLFRFFTLHARVTAHFFRRHARSVRRQIEENDNDDAQGYPIIPTGLDRREPLDPLLATTSRTRDTIITQRMHA